MTAPQGPQVDDLTYLLYGNSGREVDEWQGQLAISTITQLANAYTRGVGFTDGVPNADIAAVIVTAAGAIGGQSEADSGR